MNSQLLGRERTQKLETFFVHSVCVVCFFLTNLILPFFLPILCICVFITRGFMPLAVQRRNGLQLYPLGVGVCEDFIDCSAHIYWFVCFFVCSGIWIHCFGFHIHTPQSQMYSVAAMYGQPENMIYMLPLSWICGHVDPCLGQILCSVLDPMHCSVL